MRQPLPQRPQHALHVVAVGKEQPEVGAAPQGACRLRCHGLYVKEAIVCRILELVQDDHELLRPRQRPVTKVSEVGLRRGPPAQALGEVGRSEELARRGVWPGHNDCPAAQRLQVRDQARADQRTLAHARSTDEERYGMGTHKADEVQDVLLSPREEVDALPVVRVHPRQFSPWRLGGRGLKLGRLPLDVMLELVRQPIVGQVVSDGTPLLRDHVLPAVEESRELLRGRVQHCDLDAAAVAPPSRDALAHEERIALQILLVFRAHSQVGRSRGVGVKQVSRPQDHRQPAKVGLSCFKGERLSKPFQRPAAVLARERVDAHDARDGLRFGRLEAQSGRIASHVLG